MCDTLYDAPQRIVANANTDIGSKKNNDSQFVFTNDKGLPLDTHFIEKKLWYPALKKSGLKRSSPYETRHTAAVLHIAAHENPLYISQMPGHSDIRLLFDVYAPYVVNASRLDGSAFDELMKHRGL